MAPTSRLAAALKEHRHLRNVRVLCRDDGQPLSRQMVQTVVKEAVRRANRQNGGVHVFRHSFCSHLSMHGVPVAIIQALAGHQELSMTQRYMHLSPEALDEAIRAVDSRRRSGFGDSVETPEGADRKSKG